MPRPRSASPSEALDDAGSAEAAPHGRRRGWVGVATRAILATVLGGAIVYSGWVVVREYEAEHLDGLARGVIANPTAVETKAFDAAILLCGQDCPARGLEAASAGKAALAEQATGARRDRLNVEAERLTRAALRRNPVSAESWARLSMILSNRAEGALTPEALKALGASFSAAPFSRAAAAWRIGFCGRHWTELDAGLRRSAAEELGWLATIDLALATSIVDRTEDPAAQFALGLRLEAAHPSAS